MFVRVLDFLLQVLFQTGSCIPIVLDVVVDIAGEARIGVRALNHAARELLAEALSAAIVRGVRGSVVIAAGPPVEISSARQGSAWRTA